MPGQLMRAAGSLLILVPFGLSRARWLDARSKPCLLLILDRPQAAQNLR
jgi:hypothetical protein